MNELKARVLRIIAEESGHEVTPDTEIEALGLDSLDFVALMQAIAAETNAEVPQDRWSELETVEDILNAVEAVSA